MGGAMGNAGLFINWSLRVGTTAKKCDSFVRFAALSRDLMFDIRLLELWVVNEVLKHNHNAPNRDFYSTVVLWNKIGRSKGKMANQSVPKPLAKDIHQFALTEKQHLTEEENYTPGKQNHRVKKESDTTNLHPVHQKHNMFEVADFSSLNNFSQRFSKGGDREQIHITPQRTFVVGMSQQEIRDMRPPMPHPRDERGKLTFAMPYPSEQFSGPLEATGRNSNMSIAGLLPYEQGMGGVKSPNLSQHVPTYEPQHGPKMGMPPNTPHPYDQRFAQLQKAPMMNTNVPLYGGETPNPFIVKNQYDAGYGGREEAGAVAGYQFNQMPQHYPSGIMPPPIRSRSNHSTGYPQGEIPPFLTAHLSNQLLSQQAISQPKLRDSPQPQRPEQLEPLVPPSVPSANITTNIPSAVLESDQNKDKILSSILSPRSSCRQQEDRQSDCHFCRCGGKKINVICSCNQENVSKIACICSKERLVAESRSKKRRSKRKESDKTSKKEAKRREKEEKNRRKKELKEQKAKEKESRKQSKKSKQGRRKKSRKRKSGTKCTCCNCTEHPVCGCVSDTIVSSDESTQRKKGCCGRKKTKKVQEKKVVEHRTSESEVKCKEECVPDRKIEYCNHPKIPCPAIAEGAQCCCRARNKSSQKEVSHLSGEPCDSRTCSARQNNSCTCYLTGAICNCNCVRKKSHIDSTENIVHAAPALMIPSEMGNGDSQERKPYEFLINPSKSHQFTRVPTSVSPSGNIVIDLSKKGNSSRQVVPPCVLYLDCTQVNDLCVIIRNLGEEPS